VKLPVRGALVSLRDVGLDDADLLDSGRRTLPCGVRSTISMLPSPVDRNALAKVRFERAERRAAGGAHH
jgi:hypothetical protein